MTLMKEKCKVAMQKPEERSAWKKGTISGKWKPRSQGWKAGGRRFCCTAAAARAPARCLNNIEPEEEDLHRLSEQERLLSLLPEEVPMLPCGYDHEAFEAFAPALADAPEGGERCLACFAMRLNYTAEQAKEHGFEYFTTTLSVSPHKNADNVNRIGEEAGKRYGVKYLFADFKKKNGYLRSLELSREYELYRQDYCGCRYSNQKNSDLSTMKNEE